MSTKNLTKNKTTLSQIEEKTVNNFITHSASFYFDSRKNCEWKFFLLIKQVVVAITRDENLKEKSKINNTTILFIFQILYIEFNNFSLSPTH